MQHFGDLCCPLSHAICQLDLILIESWWKLRSLFPCHDNPEWRRQGRIFHYMSGGIANHDLFQQQNAITILPVLYQILCQAIQISTFNNTYRMQERKKHTIPCCRKKAWKLCRIASCPP